MNTIKTAIELTIKMLIELINGKLTTFKTLKITNKFNDIVENITRPVFVGIREYLSVTTGEIANHVILCNFNYKNAVLRDLAKLNNITENEIKLIAEKSNLSINLILDAVDKLKGSFIKNLNPATASNSSLAQKEIYTWVNDAIKIHNETKQVYIYGLAIAKKVLTEGEYKSINSRPLTLAQNAVKKELNFSTSKYRQFIISPENLSAVKIDGNELTI